MGRNEKPDRKPIRKRRRVDEDRVPEVLRALGGCFKALTPLSIEERREVLKLVDAELREMSKDRGRVKSEGSDRVE